MNSFSIVIPLFNKESQIKSTIDSLLNQTYPNWECLVIDDGSTDESGSIVKKIKDPRIKYIKKENDGPSSARNMGVKYATSNWILFLDADDYLLKDSLAHYNTLIEKHGNVKCFVCNMYLKSGNKLRIYSYAYKNGIINNNFLSVVLGQCRMRAGTTIFHRDVFNHYWFNNSLRRYEDAEFTYKIMLNFKVYESSKPVFVYNLDSLAASGKRNEIKEDYLGHLNLIDGNFFYNIMICSLYFQALILYPEDCKKLYSNISRRYFLIWSARLLRNRYSQAFFRKCFILRYML